MRNYSKWNAEKLIRVFASLGERLRAVKTPKEAAQVILSVADELFGWDSCYITRYSEEEGITSEIMIMDTLDGKKREIPPSYSLSPPGVMFRRVMEKGAQLILRTKESKKHEGLIPFGNKSRHSASLMFVPIRRGEKCIGMLSIQSYKYKAYDKKDHKLVQILADYCGETLKRAVAETHLHDLRNDYHLLQQAMISRKLEHPEAFSEIITRSPTMHSIFQYVEAIAGTSKTVLITGETGVGKELIAQAIHKLSGRTGSSVIVNIAGLDDNVFTDTLFGHRKGAFTGADESRRGLIEVAAGGTLFLDEIGDLNMMSQIKLLRLLQEGEYFPLGSDEPKRSDARILVATNQDLDFLLAQGQFRKDLYYRIKMHHVHIPPLRKRMEDLSLLVDHFLARASKALGKKKPTPPKELVQYLSTYHFPGNVRELESMIFDSVSHHKTRMISMMGFMDFVRKVDQGWKEEESAPLTSGDWGLVFPEKLPTLNEGTRLLVSEALQRAGGNQALAAKLLGISAPALSRRLKRWRRSGSKKNSS